MKIILVPTDFSANAFTAARYAAELAKKKGWQVELCHAFRPFSSGFQSERQNQFDKQQASKDVTDEMIRLVNRLRRIYPKVEIKGECVIGHLNDVIRQQTEDKPIHLIVMGTKGANALAQKLFGSNTFATIEKCDIPVMAIPKKVKSFEFEKVGFTTNYHAAEIAALQDFIDTMENSLEVIPFHLYKKDKQKEEARMDKWKLKLNKMLSGKKMDCRLVLSRKLPAGINRFIKKESLDALAMTVVDKNLFKRLFAKDLVSAVAHHPLVPVLFMKEN
jgi:nucleotide-binding universal stress UspA family protein